MSRKAPCYWTRKLELELVEFVREKEFIWKTVGNTNHHIQQKYKAYAEFAARQGRGFTASAVRDRWVNIRNTFNHNVRKVERSKSLAASSSEVYVPCWPLWRPLQFLREAVVKQEPQYPYTVEILNSSYKHTEQSIVKKENQSEMEDVIVNIRQPTDRTDRPRYKPVISKKKSVKCAQVLDNLIKAMKPLLQKCHPEQKYWFFGKHVVETLSHMRDVDARCASREILQLMDGWPPSDNQFCKSRFSETWDSI